MSSSPARRLRLLALVAVVGFAGLFLVPALVPDGTSDGFPAWRSIDGVPEVDELPGGFVGVLRIARERNSENARTSIVLTEAQSCVPVRFRMGTAAAVATSSGGTSDDDAGSSSGCEGGLRAISTLQRPGPITLQVGDTTWSFDPSKRDPRSCQLSRDRTCAYWLLGGGRFAKTLEIGGDRVGSDSPEAAVALTGSWEPGNAATPSVGHLTVPDADVFVRCAAAASPDCATKAGFTFTADLP